MVTALRIYLKISFPGGLQRACPSFVPLSSGLTEQGHHTEGQVHLEWQGDLKALVDVTRCPQGSLITGQVSAFLPNFVELTVLKPKDGADGGPD